ncbi:hypothetical protein ACJ41O_010716 [Fusarium nematophilum]
MSRAESIPAALWESQKDRIRSLYLDQDKTLDEVRQIMADQHGFHASKPQYIRRVTVLWKMRKNSTKEEWAQAGALLAKRKAEGKPTDLMMVNKIVPKKKLKKELKRYVGQVETTARNDELSVAEMITLINKAVPQRPGYPQHQLVATSQPWIALFRHTIYLSTNGLLSGTGTDELLRLAIEIGAMAALKEAVLISSPESKMFASNLLFSAIRVQKNSDLGLFRFLLRLGVNPDSVESHPGAGQRRTALQTTICEENIRAVQLLLDFGADPNAMCKGVQGEKRSPLNLALWEPQRSSIAEVLIKAKADLTATVFMQDGEPQSPIMLAARNRDIDRIKQLIRGGADPNHLAPHGLSALHLAIRNGDQDIVEALLKGGADPNLLCESKHIDTMQEAKHQLVEERHQRWIFTLCSPIKAAASVGELPIMKSLLAAGADPDSYVDPGPYARRGYFTYDTNTALQDAIRYGLYDLAEFLLNNAARYGGRTALQAAAESGNMGLINLLLRHGANPTAEAAETNGMTCIQAAASSGNMDLLEMILQLFGSQAGQEDVNLALQAAVKSGSTAGVQKLLDIGTDINTKQSEYSLLSEAIWQNDRDMFDFLLSKGADSDPLDTNATPLWAAVHEGHRYMAQRLIKAGADVNLPSFHHVNAPPARSGGATALQYATRLGDFNIARLLLENGANINAPPASERGATALQYAAMNGHLNIAILLLEEGALINAPASPVEGRTALQGAAEHGRLDMVHLLLENDEDPGLEERCRAAAEFAEREDHPVIAEKLRDPVIRPVPVTSAIIMSLLSLFRKETRFRYDSELDSESLRLVRFCEPVGLHRPGKISLELSTHSIEDVKNSIRYHALSYTWGPPERDGSHTSADSKSILVNGERFPVYPNLHDALARLRDARRAVYYWIDAVYINQNNEAEKGAQVSIMGDIFAMATRVDIWVGRGNKDSREALGLILKLAGLLHKTDPRELLRRAHNPSRFKH